MAEQSKLELLINRGDIKNHKFNTSVLECSADLKDGEVLLSIDKFAFTSNNITYATLGQRLRYWDFFPAPEGYGIIPVWGFSNVIQSRHEDIEIGERIYGYFPSASHLKIRAGDVKHSSFIDTADHRKELAAIYNTYQRSSNDFNYKPEYEVYQMLFQPLFTTAFLLEDFLKESDFFKAKQLLITSASSKTALGLAFLLSNSQSNVEIIGLTSDSNKEFVKGLGHFDRVLGYKEIQKLDKTDTCIAEFSGNKYLLSEIEAQLGDRIQYCSMIGLSHWDQTQSAEQLNMKSEVFFAPGQYKKRLEEWGYEALQKKLGQATLNFIQSTSSWLQVRESKGSDAFSALYLNMLEGKVDPKIGHVVFM